MITLTPPPGIYSDISEVTINGPEGYQVIVSNNGPDPVLVRTVASSNKDGTDRPYIQYMDDGRGRVILDGSFVKYYNSQATTDKTTYANVFLKNCIDYISPVENPRILFLGDRIAPVGESLPYMIKGTSSDGFKTFFETFCDNFDFTYDIKDPLDYGGELDFDLSELSKYQVLFFMGARSVNQDSIPIVSERLARAIATFREEGKGVYLCTDHNAFFHNNNIILSYITDAQFEGSYDFSPGTTVAYNRTLHGDSPLFRGLSDTTIMRGSTSDSSVQQNIELPLSLPVTVPIDEGHNAFKLGVIDPDGNMQFFHYYYGINEAPVIELLDEDGNVINEWEQTNLRQRRVYFRYNDTGIGPCSGYVRAGNTVIGTFEDHPPGPLDVMWLNTEFTISALGELVTMTGDKNLDISVEFYEPFEYRVAWPFNRFIPGSYNSSAEAFNDLNRNEFKVTEPSFGQLIRKASEVVYNPSIRSTDSVAEYLKNIHTALTVQLPNMLYTPSSQDIFNTFDKYVVGSGVNPDADFTLKSGVLTNVRNANGSCMLVNPDNYHAYQSVILSSTNGDDDGIGLVFASRETPTEFFLAAVELRLDQSNYPRIRVRYFRLMKPFEVGVPGIEVTEAIPPASLSTTIEILALTDHQTRNADGFKGWLSPGWKDGVHISVEYLDETLTVRMNPPGERPSDNYQYVYTGTSQNISQLKGMVGASGLYVQSQASSYWSNYAIIRLDE